MLIGLIVATPALWGLAYFSHPRITVGVVLVDALDTHYGNITLQGFQIYDDYFEGRLLPEGFNASQVRVKDGYHLNSDFFSLGRPEQIRKNHSVDVVLFLTGHKINNYDGNGKGYWGQAHAPSSSVLVTVAPFSNLSAWHVRGIQQTALHEVFHLLGYTHNTRGAVGIMSYGEVPYEVQLVPYKEFQLPVRCWGYQLVQGHSNVMTTLVTSLLFILTILPWFAAVEYSIYRYFSTRPLRSPHHGLLVYPCMVQALFILILFLDRFLIWLFPILVMGYVHWFYQRLEEVQMRGKAKAKTNL